MKRLALILASLVGILPAYGAHEFVPIQERAQGQALAGASQLNDSLYSNPAGAAFTQVYTVDGTYSLPKSFGVSILDTKSSGIGAGLGYFRINQGEGIEPLQGAKLAVMGKMTEAIGLGFSGKLLWGSDTHGNHQNLKDLDAGVLVKLQPVHLGLTFRNLFGGNAPLDQKPEWAFGGSLGVMGSLFLNAAVLGEMKSLKPYQYGFGMEYVSQYYFSLKGGYRIQPDRDRSYWSGGISFLAPKISFHYSVEFPNAPGEKAEHLVGTTVLL
jgi:hypothetical protein